MEREPARFTTDRDNSNHVKHRRASWTMLPTRHPTPTGVGASRQGLAESLFFVAVQASSSLPCSPLSLPALGYFNNNKNLLKEYSVAIRKTLKRMESVDVS